MTLDGQEESAHQHAIVGKVLNPLQAVRRVEHGEDVAAANRECGRLQEAARLIADLEDWADRAAGCDADHGVSPAVERQVVASTRRHDRCRLLEPTEGKGRQRRDGLQRFNLKSSERSGSEDAAEACGQRRGTPSQPEGATQPGRYARSCHER